MEARGRRRCLRAARIPDAPLRRRPGLVRHANRGRWIYSKEKWADVPNEPEWLGVGYITADLGGILLLVSVILAGFGARRLARADGGSSILARSAGVIALVVLALYLVALWAMTAKPG